MIPMVDLKTQYLNLKEEIDPALEEALHGCAFVLGPNVQAFEREAAAYLGVGHAVGCASGTDALHLALLAAGVGPGGAVIAHRAGRGTGAPNRGGNARGRGDQKSTRGRCAGTRIQDLG